MKFREKTIFRILFAASTFFLATSLPSDLNAQCDSPVGLQINEETKDGEVGGIKIYGTDGTDACDTGISVCGDVEVKGLFAIEEKAEVRFSGSKWTSSNKATFEGKGAIRVVENTDCGTTGTPEIDGGGDCTSPEKVFPKMILETSKNVKFTGKTAVKSFEFVKGKAILEDDLCVENVTGACADKYFVTNSDIGATKGLLTSKFINDAVFHIGTDTEYAPIKLENSSGSEETVAVRSLKSSYTDGASGTEMTTASGTSWEVKGLSDQAQISISVATTGASKGGEFQDDRNFLARYIGVMENEVGGYKSESKWDYTGSAGCGTVSDETPTEVCDESKSAYFGKSRSFEDVVMSETELFSVQRCKPNCPKFALFDPNKGYLICFDEEDGLQTTDETGLVKMNDKVENFTRVDEKYESKKTGSASRKGYCIEIKNFNPASTISILGCNEFPVGVGQLPVELTSFDATEKDCEVTLAWETASEENNDFFEVQRSVNGRNYEAIGLLDGAGSTANTQHYRFIDKTPVAFAYYRLRQVDFDGTEDFSPIVRVNSTCFDRTVIKTVYPNPTNRAWVNLELASKGFGDVRLTISDLLGRQIQVRTHDLTDGINNIKLDISQMPAGTYFIQLYDDVSSIGTPVKLIKTQQQ